MVLYGLLWPFTIFYGRFMLLYSLLWQHINLIRVISFFLANRSKSIIHYIAMANQNCEIKLSRKFLFIFTQTFFIAYWEFTRAVKKEICFEHCALVPPPSPTGKLCTHTIHIRTWKMCLTLFMIDCWEKYLQKTVEK